MARKTAKLSDDENGRDGSEDNRVGKEAGDDGNRGSVDEGERGVGSVEGEAGGSGETEATEGKSAEEEIGDEAPKKRRGRPPGSKNKSGVSPGEKPVSVKLKNNQASWLGKKLTELHAALAMKTNMGFLAISEDEGLMIASAGNEVASFYNVKADPKIVAWSKLAGVLGMVYGPKALILMKIKKAANQSKPRQPVQPAQKAEPVNTGDDMNMDQSSSVHVRAAMASMSGNA